MTAFKQLQIINRVMSDPISTLQIIDNEVYVCNRYILFHFKELLNNYTEKDVHRFNVLEILNFYKNNNSITVPTLKEVREFYKNNPNKPFKIDNINLSPYWLKTILECMSPDLFYKGNAIYGNDNDNEAVLMIIGG